LRAAFELLVEHPDRPFSHEAVAKAAGVGAECAYKDIAEGELPRSKVLPHAVIDHQKLPVRPLLAKCATKARSMEASRRGLLRLRVQPARRN
jgi:hypothetical protein